MPTFRDLHQSGNPFNLANARDVGNAKMLAGLGAQAIATSSAAHAFTLGWPDLGNVTRDKALAHAQDLITAVDVLVSDDFENGFGDDPGTCAQTVRLAGKTGWRGDSRGIIDTAKAMFVQGDFTPLTHSISGDVVDDLLSALPRIKSGAVTRSVSPRPVTLFFHPQECEHSQRW
ncbi:isocitrate lyase/phosphoenolpyruvate mutase family protein [Profundibacter sp.]